MDTAHVGGQAEVVQQEHGWHRLRAQLLFLVEGAFTHPEDAVSVLWEGVYQEAASGCPQRRHVKNPSSCV